MISVVLFIDFLLLGWTIYSLVRLWEAFHLYRLRKHYTAAVDPPSVSVCIPARNEMHAMSECLERVLASDYKKMEVIVYDDSSADDTSLIVRTFAQAGVRFVAGSALPEGWLGKNHALDVLTREASGTYVIFMDVDTNIRPNTISLLVSYLITEKLDMLSVLPRREDLPRASALFGTLRYWWLLVLPWTHPPVSASLWMINRVRLLEEFDGFRRFSMSVTPETAIARREASSYRPLLGGTDFGVSFEKKLSSQYETSRRLLYPLFGGKWFTAVGASVFLFFLAFPVLFLPIALVMGWTPLHTLALCIVLVMSGAYGIYLQKMWSRGWWYGMFLWPAVIMQECALFVASTASYIQGKVTWKGRSVVARKKA